MANCDECGAYYRDIDDCGIFQDPQGFGDRCSKYCYERSWAATMDGYDVDDPDNPAYSDRTSSSSESYSGCVYIIFITLFFIYLLLDKWFG